MKHKKVELRINDEAVIQFFLRVQLNAEAETGPTPQEVLRCVKLACAALDIRIYEHDDTDREP